MTVANPQLSAIAAMPTKPTETESAAEPAVSLKKYWEDLEQALTIQLNAVRAQLHKPPISQRKLQAMLNQKCSDCGKSMS